MVKWDNDAVKTTVNRQAEKLLSSILPKAIAHAFRFQVAKNSVLEICTLSVTLHRIRCFAALFFGNL